LQRFLRETAMLFGVGRLRPAPGTWGSLVAVLLAAPLVEAGGVAALAVALAGSIALGLLASAAHERSGGGHDASEVVIDEVAGQWLTVLLLLLFREGKPDWTDYAAAFAAFRLFDIVKPWPIGMLDRRVTGAVGTMLDDLVAAVPAAGLVVLAHLALAALMP